MSAALDFRGSGYDSLAELDEWLEFVAWSQDPEADPWAYAFDDALGWFPALIVRAADVLPFISALAAVLVADLLRFSRQNA